MQQYKNRNALSDRFGPIVAEIKKIQYLIYTFSLCLLPNFTLGLFTKRNTLTVWASSLRFWAASLTVLRCR